MARESRLAFKPRYPRSLTNEFCGGQFPTAGQPQQGRGNVADTFADPFGQRVDLLGEPGDLAELIAGQLGDQTGLGGQPVTQQSAMLSQIQRSRLGSALRIEFMDPPPQPVDRRGPLRDKDFATIHQQFQLT
jgi:hypothetical protein